MRFGTYAYKIIKRHIYETKNWRSMIRVPDHLHKDVTELANGAKEESSDTPVVLAHHASKDYFILKIEGKGRQTSLGKTQNFYDTPYFREKKRQDIIEAVSHLPKHLARIITLRYGLEDGVTRTFQQIGDMFGTSRENIQQREKEALKILRIPEYSAHLHVYYDG